MYAEAHVWTLEDNSVELVISFHLYLGSENQTLDARLVLQARLPTQLSYKSFFTQGFKSDFKKTCGFIDAAKLWRRTKLSKRAFRCSVIETVGTLSPDQPSLLMFVDCSCCESVLLLWSTHWVPMSEFR